MTDRYEAVIRMNNGDKYSFAGTSTEVACKVEPLRHGQTIHIDSPNRRERTTIYPSGVASITTRSILSSRRAGQVDGL